MVRMVARRKVTRLIGNDRVDVREDVLAVEEPLEIRVGGRDHAGGTVQDCEVLRGCER